VVALRTDRVLAEAVRAWVIEERPGDRATASRAAAVAQDCYTNGGSVSEACHQAHAFVDSWTRHPAHKQARSRRRGPFPF
jgi:hypothetical protein